MINELGCIWEEVIVSYSDIIPEFAWQDWVNPQNNVNKAAGLQDS